MNSEETQPKLTPSFPLSSKETSRVVTAVDSPMPHLGWHSRGYLPHWDHPGMLQAINFRLADSMPVSVVMKWKSELSLHPQENRERELRNRMEKYLDAGHGKCWLRLEAVAKLIVDALLYFNGERYGLLAWCVMPNHVHVLIETKEKFPMDEVVHAWKSFTAHRANEILGLEGQFWQREYLDRYIRNVEHYEKAIAYIEENPVKAGLVKIKTEWPWSSAKLRLPGSATLPAN